MGTIISLVRKKSPIPDLVELSDEDINNIQKTWETPRAAPLDAGETILFRFLEAYPQYQHKFPHFRNIPLITLKGAPGFRTHAGRIVAVFDETIEELGKDDYEGQMKVIWTIMGRNHYRRTIPRKAFEDLKEVIMDVLKEVCTLTPEECKSWDRFINNIYHVLFKTMERAAAEN